jgi:hypothetical protein
MASGTQQSAVLVLKPFAASLRYGGKSRSHLSGEGGPLPMATLTIASGKPKIQFVEDPAEQIEAVSQAENALKEHIEKSLGSGAPEPGAAGTPKPS